MNQSDMQSFFEMWSSAAEMYGKTVSENMLAMTFSLLSAYEIEDVRAATESHLRDPEAGKWMPKPADIIQKIGGTLPKPGEIVGLARACNTPVGCFARMIIGKWDLDNQDSFYLNQRGEEVKALLPDFVRRAREGQYTDGEISLMKSKNINLGSELSPGLPGPGNDAARLVHSRALRIEAHVPTNSDNPKDTPDQAKHSLRLIEETTGKVKV